MHTTLWDVLELVKVGQTHTHTHDTMLLDLIDPELVKTGHTHTHTHTLYHSVGCP